MDLSPEIEAKMGAMVEGVRLDPAALEGVGERYKENVPLIFDYCAEYVEHAFPCDIRFPLGSVVFVRVDPRSPYLIRKEDGVLVLEKEGRFVSTVEWTERPAYYGQCTSDGLEMRKVIPLIGECCGAIMFSYYCMNWEGGLQCRFCNINATANHHKDAILPSKRADQIGETAAAALKERPYIHLILSGGSLPRTRVSDACIAIMEAVKRHSGREDVPFGLNIAAPRDLSENERLYEAGARSVVYDIEVWDRNMFEALCPGKAKNLGRDIYERALDHAVTVFGKGNVYTQLVLGLEEKVHYFEAAQSLAERGIVLLLQPWFVGVGSKLEGHRAPYPEWMLEVNEKVVRIMGRHLPEVLAEEWSRRGLLNCYRCANYTLLWDEVRRQIGGVEIDR
ncbi:MAG: hypothetical protein HYS70_04420 [Nitrospinae bacterium]|nr:hypothetical protein [Nitrospinota bacterium]